MKIIDIQKLSDDELAEKLRNSEFDSSARENIATEIQRRSLIQMRKTHWTVTPSFWIIVITMLLAAIAAWPVIRGCSQVFQPENIISNSQSQQSQSEATSPKENKK